MPTPLLHPQLTQGVCVPFSLSAPTRSTLTWEKTPLNSMELALMVQPYISGYGVV